MPLKSKQSVRDTPKGYWKDIAKRKQFFVDAARHLGFDPYQPENWYNVNRFQIIRKQVRKGKGKAF